MGDFILGEFLDFLDKGTIIKDSNMFTIFSKNIELIINFYGKYLREETKDLAGDLRKLLNGVYKYVSCP